MHAIGLLAQWLAQHTVIGHRARQAALLSLAVAITGSVWPIQARSIEAIFDTYKPRVGRPPLTRPQGGRVRQYRRLHRAPWLLATSLPHGRDSSRRIQQLYAQRMQIEETFRDIKSHRWGFGLNYARCGDGRRIEVLLLIGTLASLVLWLVGVHGRTLDWVRRLQANTETRKPVLSTVFVGRQLLRRPDLPFSKADLQLALNELRGMILRASAL